VSPIRRLAAPLAAAPRPVRLFLLGSVFLGIGVAFFEVLTNLYLQGEGVPKETIGAVLSQRAIGTVAGALVAGPLLSRRRTPFVLAAASALLAASMTVIVLANGNGWREASATAFGFAVTFRLVASGPLLFRNVEDRWVAALFGFDAAVIAGTQVLGSGIAAGLLEVFEVATGSRSASLRAAMVVGAGFVGLSSLAYAAIREAPAARDVSAPAAPAWPPLGLTLRLCLPFFLVGAGAGLTIPYLNLYFEDRFDASASMISLFYAAVAATTTFGYLGSPWLARRIGLVRSVVWSEILSIPFFLVLAFSRSYALSVAAFLMRGALMNLPYPLYGNFIMRIVGPEQRERANALTKLAWHGSWVVTSRVAGALLGEHANYTPVMLATAALYLAASSSFWLMFRHAEDIP
jgi:MFS family permease